jgi:hypothetical protein
MPVVDDVGRLLGVGTEADPLFRGAYRPSPRRRSGRLVERDRGTPSRMGQYRSTTDSWWAQALSSSFRQTVDVTTALRMSYVTALICFVLSTECKTWLQTISTE